MKMSDIVRETVGEPLVVGSLSAQVRDMAREQLGYACQVNTNRAAEESILLEAIRRLGIEVLNEQSVRKYQAERLSQAYVQQRLTDFNWGWTSGPTWERKDLKKYTKPIPDFALERAIQLKAACPAVEFWVEELTERTNPFLIAHVGSDGYYIAVWEEAQFEAGL